MKCRAILIPILALAPLGAVLVPRVLKPLHAFFSRIPVLVINGYFDPITPPGYIRRLRAGFPNARHAFLPEGSHREPSRRTLGCLRRITAAFLDDPSARLNTACESY